MNILLISIKPINWEGVHQKLKICSLSPILKKLYPTLTQNMCNVSATRLSILLVGL
jgi:hypothetical protein